MAGMARRWRGAAVTATLFAMFAAVPFARDASATDLRGRVESVNQYSSISAPVGGAQVELLEATGVRVLARYSTGPDGFYYLRNIAPGKYQLRVAGRAYPLTVQRGPTQDIGPIRLQR